MAKLTAAGVRNAKPGRHYDEHGLCLVVKPSGARSWVQRLTIRGRRRDLGLGGFPLVTLAEARATALENRRLARAGGDPIALRNAGAAPTFREAVDRVIAIHEPNWKDGGKSAKQWRSQMRDYALPKLGRLRVDEITPADVMRVLLPIWTTKRETARKLRARIGMCMKWAVAEGWRSDNPAGDAIGAALPRNGAHKRHQKALPHRDVAGAIAKVRASNATTAARLAFEFLVLTACRSGEVRGARWSEIDLDEALWTIPGERTKTGREHRVPLSNRALAILDEAAGIADGSGRVFPSPTGRALSDSTLSKLVRELGIEAVPHGFRSSFRDWCGEATSAPREVAEAALGHAVGNVVEAAYARSDLFDKRRDLMQRWARYLNPTAAPVVPLRVDGTDASA